MSYPLWSFCLEADLLLSGLAESIPWPGRLRADSSLPVSVMTRMSLPSQISF